MEFDINARNLGYPTADHWLRLVESEALFDTIDPVRYTEYARIFTHRRALTLYESQLLAAIDDADWVWLEEHRCLTVDGCLTDGATASKYAALAAIEAN